MTYKPLIDDAFQTSRIERISGKGSQLLNQYLAYYDSHWTVVITRMDLKTDAASVTGIVMDIGHLVVVHPD